ncbi:MAG: YggU family protein [Chloroflexi bacterium]|nr:YggU family protein [Chloroflexota bacterium]
MKSPAAGEANDDPVRATTGGVMLIVRVLPRASRNQVVGVEQGAIKIKLTAPPVEGAANAALIELIAGWLGVRRSSVSIVSGETARHKRVQVAGLTVEGVRQKL